MWARLSLNEVAVLLAVVLEVARHTCEGIAKMVCEAAEEAESQARKDSTVQWRTWEAKAAEGGSSVAHAWNKEAVGWVQPVVKDGSLISCHSWVLPRPRVRAVARKVG